MGKSTAPAETQQVRTLEASTEIQEINHEQAALDALGAIVSYREEWQKSKVRYDRAEGLDSALNNEYGVVNREMDNRLQNFFDHNLILGVAEVIPIQLNDAE